MHSFINELCTGKVVCTDMRSLHAHSVLTIFSLLLLITAFCYHFHVNRFLNFSGQTASYIDSRHFKKFDLITVISIFLALVIFSLRAISDMICFSDIIDDISDMRAISYDM